MTDELSWPDGKTLALSVVVNVEEVSEMSIADGDKTPEPVDELGGRLAPRSATTATKPTVSTASAPAARASSSCWRSTA